MNQGTFRVATRILVVLVLLCVPSIALADGLSWSLSGVTFDDGGAASGSFVYDASTNTVSSVNVVTTAGTTFVGATYTGVNPGFAPLSNEIVLVPNPSLPDLTGTFVLDLYFADSSLTNAGGTVSLAGLGGEYTCADSGCTGPNFDVYRLMTTGSVVGTPVATPEPSVLLLLGIGLAVLVGTTKRRLLQV